jgi:hypothetical protein
MSLIRNNADNFIKSAFVMQLTMLFIFKVMPLLMSFVRGETIEADRHFVSGDGPKAAQS